MGAFKDLTGQRFGRLIVLEKYPKRKKATMWKVVCDCGNECIVQGDNIKNGHTQSCGCYCIDRAKEANTRHGMEKTPICNVYRGIVQRCNDKNHKSYKDYGERGIKNMWDSFEEFYKDMGDTYKYGLQIDREDNDGDYCKENCRWVTQTVNANNKRNNTYVEYNGKKQTLSMRSREIGIKLSTLSMRYYHYKRSIEKLLTTKVL